MASRRTEAEEKYISSKAIRKKVKNSESVALKRYKIDDCILLDLDKVLDDIFCSFRPVSADYDTRKELVNSLNAMALDIYGNSESSPVLEAYGSFVMDMFSPLSDLDVSINFNIGTSELSREMKLQILKRFAKKLHSFEGQGIVRNVESIFTARVPIVKFSDHETGVECDLSVENKAGILNSQIIRIISKIDDRFQKLCMLVKHWAKAHEVNSTLHRTLSSLSITLLVALHLQSQNPPILPPFSILFKDGIDPPKVEKRTQKFLNWGRRNQESLGRLFATFFIKLQSVEFLWRQGLCVSVLNGLWISKKWKKTGVGSISVEDFTDVSQNVARRVNDKGAKEIYSSINRTVEDIFEFLNGEVTVTHLRIKLFGQQAVVGPPPPLVASLNGKIAGKHLNRRLFGQQAVLEPPIPVPLLNAKIAETDLRHRLFGHQAVVEPPPPTLPLSGKIAGTHLSRRLFVQQAVVEPPLLVPLLNAKIAETDLRHRLSGQPAAVEPPPHVPPLNVYCQQPHGDYRNRFSGPPEEHQNKRVCLGNGYRTVELTGHKREEERYEDVRGKRNRYVRNCNGFEEYREIPWFVQVPLNGGANGHLVHHVHDGRFSGEESMPVGLWQDNSRRIGPPQPQPPNGRASYENFDLRQILNTKFD